MSLLLKNIYIFIQTHKDVLFSSLKKNINSHTKKKKHDILIQNNYLIIQPMATQNAMTN